MKMLRIAFLFIFFLFYYNFLITLSLKKSIINDWLIHIEILLVRMSIIFIYEFIFHFHVAKCEIGKRK